MSAYDQVVYKCNMAISKHVSRCDLVMFLAFEKVNYLRNKFLNSLNVHETIELQYTPTPMGTGKVYVFDMICWESYSSLWYCLSL